MRLINADKVKAESREHCKTCILNGTKHCDKTCVINLICDRLDLQPTIQEVPHKDLISRKWLVDAIEGRRTYLSYEDARDVIDLIEKAPTVTEGAQGEWIAVTDKLPDKDGEYLVSLENGRIVVADERSIIENHDFEPKMLAWQALPEAYKKEGAE